ncbi:V-type ATPase subunit [bacterium]|nr:V-type ATPase subunit [bacterium]
MLKSAFHYSYINAKVRSLKSRLLSRADFENMALLSGLAGICEYLKTTSYGNRWDQFPSSFDGLILMYYEDLFDCYQKVINVLTGSRKRFIQHLYQRYETENLKLVLRLVHRGQPGNEHAHLLLPIKKHQTFLPEDLFQAKNIKEIPDRLHKTWYCDTLKNTLHRYEKERMTFPLEMALDLAYYNHLWQYLSALRGRDRKIARHLIGVQLDGINILWMFRFKEIYRFSPEETLNYSIMNGFHLSSKIRLKLAYSADYEDMVTNLTGTPYHDLASDTQDPDILFMKLLSCGLSLAHKNWSRDPFQIGTVIDYLLFKEAEVKDLIMLTESKRLNLPQKRVEDYLINCR